MTDGGVDGDRFARGAETRSVERPTAAAAASTIESALDRGRAVSLFGECEVHAAEPLRLPTGGCHALLKPDGSVVVHGGDGTAPDVVLQGTEGLDVTVVDGAPVVAVKGDGEVHRLRFDRVDLLASAAIDESPDAQGNEDRTDAASDATGGSGDRHAALRDRLLSDPDRVEPGFEPLATERETPAGSVDLYGRDADGRTVVVEVKAHRAGPASVGQLDRYVSALRRDLHAGAEVRGILVAPSATDRTRRLLLDRGFSFRAVSPEPGT